MRFLTVMPRDFRPHLGGSSCALRFNGHSSGCLELDFWWCFFFKCLFKHTVTPPLSWWWEPLCRGRSYTFPMVIYICTPTWPFPDPRCCLVAAVLPREERKMCVLFFVLCSPLFIPCSSLLFILRVSMCARAYLGGCLCVTRPPPPPLSTERLRSSSHSFLF